MNDSTGLRTLELGITTIQAGNRSEGARLVRIAIKSGDLTGELRAIAYLWLAEAQDDPTGKQAAYREALIADPNNADARQRLAALLASQLPPTPVSLPEDTPVPAPPPPQTFPTAPAAPIATAVYTTPSYTADINTHLVGVFGGPNGQGSGFFIAPEGIIATTRYVVGGSERLTVELSPGRQVQAAVVRAYPEVDLTFLQIEVAPPTTLPIAPQPRVPDDTPLYIYGYARQPLSGVQRPTKRALAGHWVPTTFTELDDAGGAPVIDPYGYLVGMATRNTARNSGHYFALHIGAVRARLETLLAEMRTEARAYCPSCGSGSRAGGAGFFYCEVCGSTVPRARHIQRYPLPQAEYYYGASGPQCTRCGSRVGFYKGNCMCCGQPAETRAL